MDIQDIDEMIPGADNAAAAPRLSQPFENSQHFAIASDVTIPNEILEHMVDEYERANNVPNMFDNLMYGSVSNDDDEDIVGGDKTDESDVDEDNSNPFSAMYSSSAASDNDESENDDVNDDDSDSDSDSDSGGNTTSEEESSDDSDSEVGKFKLYNITIRLSLLLFLLLWKMIANTIN